MKKTFVFVSTLLTAVAIGGAAMAEEKAPIIHEGRSAELPVTELKFFPSGVKTDVGELYAAPAFGDLAHGKHGTFIRMPAGYVSTLHTHTEDYFGVVINGVGANERPGEADRPLAPGSYWFQRGEEPHITKCLSKVDCLFFIVQPGAFDYIPTAK